MMRPRGYQTSGKLVYISNHLLAECRKTRTVVLEGEDRISIHKYQFITETVTYSKKDIGACMIR